MRWGTLAQMFSVQNFFYESTWPFPCSLEWRCGYVNKHFQNFWEQSTWMLYQMWSDACVIGSWKPADDFKWQKKDWQRKLTSSLSALSVVGVYTLYHHLAAPEVGASHLIFIQLGKAEKIDTQSCNESFSASPTIFQIMTWDFLFFMKAQPI